jgi:DNA-binding NtrC family response regulator
MAKHYVLVVEDEPLVRAMLSRWMEHFGFDVCAVANADEGLAAVLERLPDVVITDIYMPVHDGLWLLEQVRAKWPALPVIMASGAQHEQTIVTARKLGAVDFVPKPFGREVMRQALRRALSVHA